MKRTFRVFFYVEVDCDEEKLRNAIEFNIKEDIKKNLAHKVRDDLGIAISEVTR